MQREYKISLSQEYYSDVIYLSQYDSDYNIVFNVIDKYSAASVDGCTARFTGLRNDGLGFTFESTGSGTTVTFTIDTTLTAVSGTQTGEIIFYDDNGLYFGSANVQIIVEPAAQPDGTIDADTQTAQTIQQEVQEIVDTAAATVTASVTELEGEVDTNTANIATNTTAIGTLANLTTDANTNLVSAINEVDAHADTNAAAISSLNADLTQLENMSAISIMDSVSWELGTMDSSGGDASSWSRIRTDGYVDLGGAENIVCTITSGYKFVYRFFDDEYTQVSASGAGSWNTSDLTIAVPSGAVYARFLVSYSTDTNMSDTSISQYFDCSTYSSIIMAINTNTSNISVLQGTSLLDDVTWERGTLDEYGADASSTSRARTVGYIDVSSIRAILVKINDGYMYGVYTYDDSKNFLTSYVWITDSDIFVIPANVEYVRLLISANPSVWIADASIASNLRAYDKSEYTGLTGGVDGNTLSLDWFNATSVNKKEIPELTTGKTLLALGDSITAATDSTGWTYHFNAMTGMTVINKAVGGTTFGESATDDSGHWMSTQISNVTSAQWESADLVIVACGTNDYGHGTPLDELKTKVQEAITTIKANTSVPIVFITPIRRGTSTTSEPMQELPVIAGIISNVALANECNVIRGFDFPIPTYTTGYVDNFTRDGLHPNAYGANVYARSVINALV